MKNPWKEVTLDDYENHMALSNVYQLQTLDMIMGKQFSTYAVKSVAILGVAGGNGLGNLINIPTIENVYGVDINAGYLKTSEERYPQFTGRYSTLLADINEDCSNLPHVDLIVANLFIEYVGYANFTKAVRIIKPHYVSCVIQVDPEESFVSDSPYTAKLEVLDSVHNSIIPTDLISAMKKIGYTNTKDNSLSLPNGKIFLRLDFSLDKDS